MLCGVRSIMGVRSLWERGVEILYKVTLCHVKLWIMRFGRFNERGGGGVLSA